LEETIRKMEYNIDVKIRDTEMGIISLIEARKYILEARMRVQLNGRG